MLMEKIRGKEQKYSEPVQVIEPKLIIRDSTKTTCLNEGTSCNI